MASKIYVGVATTLTPVEYIESSGTQYFDSGIIPDNTIKIETQIMVTSHIGDASMALFGSRSYDSSTNSLVNAYVMWCTPDAGQGAPQAVYAYNSISTNITGYPENTLLDIEYGNNYLKYGSRTYTGTTAGAGSPTNSLIVMGTTIDSGVEGRKFCGRLYYFKIWKNDTLVRDFIPMVDNRGEGCLWDNVEQRAYYNLGTGSFGIGSATGGQSISGNFVRRVPKSYIGKKYIQSTGTEYIDTGISGAVKAEVTFGFVSMVSDACNSILWAENNGAPYGCNGARFYYGGTAQYQTIELGAGDNVTSTQLTPDIDRAYTIEIDTTPANAYLKLDGVSKLTASSSDTLTTGNLYLFANNSFGGSANNFSIMKLYGCKIWSNNVLVRDFIPAENNNVACLYDKVTETYFYNQGSGAFTYGEENRKISAAYVGVSGVARQVYSRLPYVSTSRIIYVPATEVNYVGLAATDDYIIHAGGANVSGSAPVNTVVAFNENDVKTDCANLNTAASFIGTTTFTGKAVFVSGKSASSGSSRTPQVVVYDNSLVKTKPVDLSTSRFDHSVLSDDTRMHVAGGCNYSGNLTSIETYNTSFVRQAQATGLSVSRRGASSAKVGNYFVYCGGGTGSTSYADFYDKSNTRTRGSTPFPTNLTTWYTKGITLSDSAVFCGGASAESSASATYQKIIASYNSNLVYTSTNMPYGAYKQNGFDNNGKIFFISAGSVGEDNVMKSRRLFWIYNSNLVLTGTYYTDVGTATTNQYSAASNKKFGHFRANGGSASYPPFKFEF